MDNKKQKLWNQALDIYANLSELPTNQAINQLEQLNNISLEIKQVVITLIDSGSQASTYINKHYNPADTIAAMPQFSIGSIIGEYELLENLGHGGMSQVFKAKRISDDPQKQVAIKIFSPTSYSQVLLDHFITEQKILSQLSHTNIVDMLHGGKTEDNTTYLVMELIENALPINGYFKHNQATIQKKIDYIRQSANALSYSHANLVIHRDLKPDNILIDENNHLKIVDFGIAKLIKKDDISGNNTILALTPSYAAPEQINSEQISVKTDIFSLAVVALELLIGKQILPKDRLIKSCVNDEKIIEKSLKSIKIDKDLKNILQQALQQKPELRYASMQSFADDLTCYLQNKPVSATSQSWYYRISKFAQRRRALFVTLVSLFASLLIGLAISFWQYQQIKIEAGKAQQVKQFMLDTFNVTNPNISEGNSISAKDLLKIAATKLNENKQLNPAIKFELYQTLGIANDQLGYPQEAIKLLNKSLIINPKNTKSMAYLANSYFQGNQQQALDDLLSSVDETSFVSETDRVRFSLVRAKNLSARGDSTQAIAQIDLLKTLDNVKNNTNESIKIQQVLASIYYDKSDYQKSAEILQTILAASELANTNTQILSIELDLGRTYNTMGEHKLALAELNKIEKIYQQILGDKHPDLGGLYYRMSSSFKATGQMQKAHKYAQLSYDTNIKTFGNRGKQVANSLNMLAVLAKTDGNIKKAIRLTEQAIQLLEESYDKNPILISELKTNYAHLLGLENQHEKALTILKEAYAIQIEKLGPNNFSTLNTESSLVSALISLKQIDAAKKMVLEHLQRVEDNFGSKSILTLNAYTLLARIYSHTKEQQKRLEVFLAMEKKQLVDESNPYFVMIIFNIAQAYNNVDDIEMAEQYFRKAFEFNKRIYADTHISTLQMKVQHAKYLKSRNRFEEVKKVISEVKTVIKQQNYNNTQLNSWIKQLEKN